MSPRAGSDQRQGDASGRTVDNMQASHRAVHLLEWHEHGDASCSGYRSTDNGGSAKAALLTDIVAMQPDSKGDLLVVDGPRVRRITVISNASQPLISDVVDFSGVSGLPNPLSWTDAVYDENSGEAYVVYTIAASSGVPAHAGIGRLAAGQAFHAYDFTGTLLPTDARIQLTPAGLLVLQPNLSRILVVTR